MTGYLVWGGGGHGKVVADLIRAIGGTVIGYVDADPAKLGSLVDPGGGCVLMSEADFLVSLHTTGGLPHGAGAVAVAVGANEVRMRLLAAVGALGAPALVHPSAVMSPSCVVGRCTVIFPRAVVNASSRIGEAVILNTAAVVEHDCTVGAGAHVSPGAILCGGVTVGPRSWIGAGAIVLPGIHVGRDARVGAGAVVVREVGDGATVTGIPAK